MNKNITSFYIVNKDNQTVAFGSNLKEFYIMFSNIYSESRNYQYYYRQFAKSDSFTLGSFHFQQLV